MYERISQGQHEFSFADDIFLEKTQNVNFAYNGVNLENLDVEVNLEGVIQIDQNGEYEDISCQGVAIFYTDSGQEVSRIYIDLLNLHRFNNQFKKAYNISLIEKIYKESSLSTSLDFPVSMDTRI